MELLPIGQMQLERLLVGLLQVQHSTGMGQPGLKIPTLLLMLRVILVQMVISVLLVALLLQARR
jgi:hypothetical protein